MADKKTYQLKCKVCGDGFEATAYNVAYCPECREKQHWFICEECGKSARKSRPHAYVRFCPECVVAKRHKSKPKISSNSTRKTKKAKCWSIDEIRKFGIEHHMSYGEVVARYGV